MSWENLPYVLCCEVFSYLNYVDVMKAGLVCRSWNQASRDERLWKHLFFTEFKVDKSIESQGRLWYDEFKRLKYDVPTVQAQCIYQHSDQIFHVGFAHSGKYFVTSSRDRFVKIWQCSHPVVLKETMDMNAFGWKSVNYTEFNQPDTLLLVSGIVSGPEAGGNGEIIVFDVDDNLKSNGRILMKCRIDNTPYSLFSAWYNDSMLLSGTRLWLRPFENAIIINMNRASQETTSEYIPITQNLFKFYNQNRSSITRLVIANCQRVNDDLNLVFDGSKVDEYYRNINFDLNLPMNTLVYSNLYRDYERALLPLGNISNDFFFPNFGSFDNNQNFLTSGNFASTSTDLPAKIFDTSIDQLLMMETNDNFMSGQNVDLSETASSTFALNDESEDKYLIFITGSNTFVPHEIAIKRINPFKFPDRLDPGPSLRERQRMLTERRQMFNESFEDMLYHSYDRRLRDMFDMPDDIINLKGYIIGMCLSPDHRFLYVTTKRWPHWDQTNFIFNEVSAPATPSDFSEITLWAIDVAKFEIVGKTVNSSMEPDAPDVEYYFVFMDVSDELIVSMGNGPYLQLWDRHFGIPLTILRHNDLVNASAFNPKDPNMLVSVADDGTIKIWRSKSQMKTMATNEDNLMDIIDLVDSDSSDES